MHSKIYSSFDVNTPVSGLDATWCASRKICIQGGHCDLANKPDGKVQRSLHQRPSHSNAPFVWTLLNLGFRNSGISVLGVLLNLYNSPLMKTSLTPCNQGGPSAFELSVIGRREKVIGLPKFCFSHLQPWK